MISCPRKVHKEGVKILRPVDGDPRTHGVLVNRMYNVLTSAVDKEDIDIMTLGY
jgi:hypothetical protein